MRKFNAGVVVPDDLVELDPILASPTRYGSSVLLCRRMFRPGDQIGSYLLVNRLGRGAFGEVWLAERKTKFVTTRVAVKLPLDEQVDHDAVRREATVWEQASGHPNVLPIIEANEYDGQVVIVSEYAPDGSLDDLLKDQGGVLPVERVIELTTGILSGLGFLHSKDIIHRDIKPANILLQGETPRLTDFGISRAVMAATASYNAAGTPFYMAPEAFQGKRNVQTDLWSVGIVFYQMITGEVPFKSTSVPDLISEITWDDPPPLPHALAAFFQPIIDRALDKDPAARFQDTLEMRTALKESEKRIPPDVAHALSETLRHPLASDEPAQGHRTGRRTIAVMPFKNLSGDSAVQFYEFSLADAVTTELARLPSLVVRPSSVIARYQGSERDPRQAGRELKVNSVLSAGFLRAGGRLRVTAQLLDVLTGEITWSERIDSDADDILAMQDAVTERIIDGLGYDLTADGQGGSRHRPTRNNEAYEAFLRGRDKLARFIFRSLNLTDCEAAIESFRRALELDPEFALAWSGLGACFANKVFKGIGNSEDYAEAKAAFVRALDLDPNIPEAHVLMVFIYLADGQKAKAKDQVEMLTRRFPNDARVHFVTGVWQRLNGKYHEALNTFDRFSRLDPSGIVFGAYNRARIYTRLGEYDTAEQELEIAAGAEPTNPIVSVFRAENLYHQGSPGAAENLLRKVLDDNPHLRGIRPLLAIFQAAVGKIDEAIANLSPETRESAVVDVDIAYWTASAFALLGEEDRAFEWLEIAVNLGLADANWLKKDKALASVRNDPRFDLLIQSL